MRALTTHDGGLEGPFHSKQVLCAAGNPAFDDKAGSFVNGKQRFSLWITLTKQGKISGSYSFKKVSANSWKVSGSRV